VRVAEASRAGGASRGSNGSWKGNGSGGGGGASTAGGQWTLDELIDALDAPDAYERFYPVRCLGRGGFGKAMLMRSTSCDLEMVTKKLPLATCTDDELRTLENEVRMCARLRHINIVHYLATFVRDETLLICLEHAAGGTLAACLDFRHLKNWPLPACVAARWIKQIAAAVSYMHSMHVLHRDLSANNVLLTVPPSEADDANHGSVKVSDFGLSKASTNDSRSSFGHVGITMCGTPNYFSPEIVNGERYGAPSDAWAVGLLLYEILTLRHPFLGGSLAALLKRICEGEYDQQVLDSAAHPDELKAVASRTGLLHLDPNQRLTLGELLKLPILEELDTLKQSSAHFVLE